MSIEPGSDKTTSSWYPTELSSHFFGWRAVVVERVAQGHPRFRHVQETIVSLAFQKLEIYSSQSTYHHLTNVPARARRALGPWCIFVPTYLCTTINFFHFPWRKFRALCAVSWHLRAVTPDYCWVDWSLGYFEWNISISKCLSVPSMGKSITTTNVF